MEPDQLVGAFDSIPNLLCGFMCLLANFRNQESRYLQPLADRATALLVEKANPPAITPSEYDVEEAADGESSDYDCISHYLGE